MDTSAAHPQDVSFVEHNVCVLFIRFHKCDALHKEWKELDAEKDVDFSYNVFVDNELATCGIFSTNDLWSDCEGGGSKWGRVWQSPCSLKKF